MSPDRPARIGPRGAVLIAVGAAGLVAALSLGLGPGGLVPHAGGWALARDFLAAAPHPALDYERPPFPGAPPFLVLVAGALGRTLLFAAAATSLAILGGLPLAALASDAFWTELLGPRRGAVARAPQVAVRVGIAVLRSVHELLWAVIFLAAMGLNTAAAVVALALPFAGTLAKVGSEMLDEAPGAPAGALRGLGARPLPAFLLGRFPLALPDLAAYAFYRFECAVRSSAVLGFFGYQTLGYHLDLAFGDLRYREVWTFLYALVALVLLFEAWSAALRRRFVA